LIPPPIVVALPSKRTSLTLKFKVGSKTAPLPFPPLTPIDSIFSISNSWFSTYILLREPLITGCIKAV
jgi:hypothetical protein